MNSIPKSLNPFQNWKPLTQTENRNSEIFKTPAVEQPIEKEEEILQKTSLNSSITNATFPTLQSFGVVFSNLKTTAKNYWTNRNVELTNTKIKQVFLNLLGIYSLISAYIYSGSIIPTTFSGLAGAAPLTILAATIFMYSYSLKDYDNQNCLSEIKKANQHLTLKEIVKEHSWDNIFKYDLVDQKKLHDGFLQLIDQSSFLEALKTYQMVLEISQKDFGKERNIHLTIPQPSLWKKKFFIEIQDQNIESIITRYDLEKLQSFEIISKEQFQILEKAKHIVLEKLAQKNEISTTTEEILTSEITVVSKQIEAFEENLNKDEEKLKDLFKLLKKHDNLPSSTSLIENCFSGEIDLTSFRQETKLSLEEQKAKLEACFSDTTTRLEKIQQDFTRSINIFPQKA